MVELASNKNLLFTSFVPTLQRQEEAECRVSAQWEHLVTEHPGTTANTEIPWQWVRYKYLGADRQEDSGY